MAHAPDSLVLPLAALTLLFSGLVRADQPDTRHGAVEDGWTAFSFEGGLTLTGQHARNPEIRDEAGLSLDLVATLPMGGGVWTVYVEGSTTPRGEGVTDQLPEVNADMGTALDGDGRGRLQLSVLHYTHSLTGGAITLGLLDDAGFIDRSEVANDETRQFMGAEFVNNPTIALPDYNLAAAWHYDATDPFPGLTLLLGSSHGLGDSDGRYTNLVRPYQDGKGIFAAAEGYGHFRQMLWRLGAWINSADYPRLDDETAAGSNYGLYLNVDGDQRSVRWNLRLGWANPRVSEASIFAAGALEYSPGAATLGLGVAWTGASPDLEAGADRVHLECYARFDVLPGLEITPDLQWVRHSGMDREKGNQWVGGVRVTSVF